MCRAPSRGVTPARRDWIRASRSRGRSSGLSIAGGFLIFNGMSILRPWPLAMFRNRGADWLGWPNTWLNVGYVASAREPAASIRDLMNGRNCRVLTATSQTVLLVLISNQDTCQQGRGLAQAANRDNLGRDGVLRQCLASASDRCCRRPAKVASSHHVHKRPQTSLLGHFRTSPTRNLALAYLTKPKHTPTQTPSKIIEKSHQNKCLKKPYQVCEVRRFREKWPLRAQI